MVLKVAATALTAILPSKYYVHAILTLITVLVVRAFSQGRSTNRERDLHGRVILVTGGFTPLGLTLLHHLALRGAHIIALSPLPIDSPKISILVTLLRSTTNNEQIYADECDLGDLRSVKAFCAKFMSVTGSGAAMGAGMGREQRLDAIIFGHEYRHVGGLFSSRRKDKGAREREEKERKESSLGTFLMSTMLLPALLVAPVERDIRIINIINPFYAAAVPTFPPSGSFHSLSSSSSKSSFLLPEGTRALRTAIFTRHLQRILDALPSAGQVPKTDTASAPSSGGVGAIPVISPKTQKSNIVAISVCPGISRSDIVAPMLGADGSVGEEEREKSAVGTVLYYLLQPLFRLLLKSPTAALQSVLHVLFLPTPFKSTPKSRPDSKKSPTEEDALPEEILKPGALYRECAVVKLWVPRSVDPLADVPTAPSNKGKGEDKEKEKPHDDDGELGGEVTGRLVWESFEKALKEWEDANPDPDPNTTTGKSGGASGDRGGTPPEVDRDADGEVGP
ncbi:hypothetical protein PILCRDRAFT_826151 [Piloderma croceum F 1598]|uniref:Ketoreductase (KR) domain-containing protein n=1 Tax=Piloderma croceum (strain F 1598) TaxID=765440 RepID=A0A0C3F9G5_PILCF|nr:hypothetical protein PILCRDRAFT_826151 [Piloderma croceum F 1598]